MKKLFFIMVCVAAVALAGCKDSPYSDEAAACAGTYSGTFNILKTSDNTTSTKEGKLHFKQNPLNMDNLMWEYVIELQRQKTGVYESAEDTYTAEMLSAATNLIGISQYTDETIEKILVRSEFSGSKVETKIYYKAMVLGVEADVVIATFKGDKQ